MNTSPLSSCPASSGKSPTTGSGNQAQYHGESGGMSVRPIDNPLSLSSIMGAIINNPKLASRTAIPCQITLKLINHHIRILNNPKTTEPVRNAAARGIAELIIEKLDKGDQSLQTKVQDIFNPPKETCPDDNDREKQEVTTTTTTTTQYIVNNDIAKAEVRDWRFEDAQKRCQHIIYDQENGRFKTHELQFVRYDGAHQRKNTLACREFEQLSNKTSLPTGCGVMDGDLIIKTTVSTNSLYGLKLFRIAQCIYCAVNDEFIPPETFDSLSFKIRVLHGYPAERLLNILPAENERGEFFYECQIHDKTDENLITSKNIFDIVFSDLQALIDFSQSNEKFDTLNADERIKIDMISSCPSDKLAINPEFLVSQLKSKLSNQQALFKSRDSVPNPFAPDRAFSKEAALNRYIIMQTWSNGLFDKNDPLQGKRIIDKQSFFVEGDSLNAHPVQNAIKDQ